LSDAGRFELAAAFLLLLEQQWGSGGPPDSGGPVLIPGELQAPVDPAIYLWRWKSVAYLDREALGRAMRQLEVEHRRYPGDGKHAIGAWFEEAEAALQRAGDEPAARCLHHLLRGEWGLD
jgi:hypothetical protein